MVLIGWLKQRVSFVISFISFSFFYGAYNMFSEIIYARVVETTNSCVMYAKGGYDIYKKYYARFDPELGDAREKLLANWPSDDHILSQLNESKGNAGEAKRKIIAAVLEIDEGEILERIVRKILYTAEGMRLNYEIFAATRIFSDIKEKKRMMKLALSIEFCRIGFDALNAEMKSHNEDVQATQAGIVSLQEGIVSMNAGIKRLHEIIESADAAIERVDAGIEYLEAGIKRVDAGIKRVDAGIKRVDAGIKCVQAGIKRLDVGIERLDAGIERLDAGIERLDAGIEHLQEGMVRRDATVERIMEDVKMIEVTRVRIHSLRVEDDRRDKKLRKLNKKEKENKKELKALRLAISAKQEKNRALWAQCLIKNDAVIAARAMNERALQNLIENDKRRWAEYQDLKQRLEAQIRAGYAEVIQAQQVESDRLDVMWRQVRALEASNREIATHPNFLKIIQSRCVQVVFSRIASKNISLLSMFARRSHEQFANEEREHNESTALVMKKK